MRLCLDAGDINSVPSSTNQKWLDLSGGGYDFFRGTSGSSEGTDPTFSGTPGALSTEHYSFDGGDYFTYDTTTENWMQSMGKSGTLITLVAVARIASNTKPFRFFSTLGDTFAEKGWDFGFSSSANKVIYTVTTAGGEFAWVTQGSSSNFPNLSSQLPLLAFFGMSIEVGNTSPSYTSSIVINGTTFTGNNVPLAATTINATNPARLGAAGDLNDISPNGSRLYALALWEGIKYSSNDLQKLYNEIRDRYGI